MTDSDPPSVLIVEDESDVADVYLRWLDDYDVRWVTSGEDALAEIDDSVDVVLLDRMMPGMSGEQVLAEIRSRNVDCRVAMVTAVDPGFDIIEMGFDEYLQKPPDRDQLRTTVERLIERGTLDGDLQEYYSLVSRRATLETEFVMEDLEANEEYVDLVDRIERHRATVDDSMGELSSDAEFVGAIREIVDGSNGDPGSTERDGHDRGK